MKLRIFQYYLFIQMSGEQKSSLLTNKEIEMKISEGSIEFVSPPPSLRLGPVFASYLKEGRWQLCWSEWNTGIMSFYENDALITFSLPSQSKLKPSPEIFKCSLPLDTKNESLFDKKKEKNLPTNQCFLMKRVNLTIMSFNPNKKFDFEVTQPENSQTQSSPSCHAQQEVELSTSPNSKSFSSNNKYSSLSRLSNLKEEFGIVIKCQNAHNYDIYLRCIMRIDQVIDLKKFIEKCSESLKVDELTLDPAQFSDDISIASSSISEQTPEANSSFSMFFSSSHFFNTALAPFTSSSSQKSQTRERKRSFTEEIEEKKNKKRSNSGCFSDDTIVNKKSVIFQKIRSQFMNLKPTESRSRKNSDPSTPPKRRSIRRRTRTWNLLFFNNKKRVGMEDHEADKLISEVLALQALEDSRTTPNTMNTMDSFKHTTCEVNSPDSKFPRSNTDSPSGYYNYSLNSPSFSNICTSPGMSSMRRAISKVMDKHESDTRGNDVQRRRGTFKWLPLYSYGKSDLVIGSWFFVIGSLGAVLTALLVIFNRYYGFMGVFDDGAGLTRSQFVASWILLGISATFSTLGSLAFVRAFHCDPPMRPIFGQKFQNRINEINIYNMKWEYEYIIKNFHFDYKDSIVNIDYDSLEALKNTLDVIIPSPPVLTNFYYHIQSDELLASWLFLLATLPFIPYSLIYLIGDPSPQYTNLYIAGFFGTILCNLGSLLFVKACYPSDNIHQDLLLPIAKALFGKCLSLECILHYAGNDWLGASWIFLWSSWVTCFGTLVLFIIKCGNDDPLAAVIYGTGFIENLLFLIGGAYFVAGSYQKNNSETISSVSNPLNEKHIHYEERLKKFEHLWVNKALSTPRFIEDMNEE